MIELFKKVRHIWLFCQTLYIAGTMDDSGVYGELIEKARCGDRQCMSRLAQRASVRLHEYVYRLTLKEDLAQDIVQETILEMFRIFHRLKKKDRFWDWLRSIAFNKVCNHYGKQWRQRTVPLSDEECEIAGPNSPDGLVETITAELKQIIAKSMHELEPRHRAVLAMRCYDRMSYARIAKVMGCSELGARALFVRAKKSLSKKLTGYGLDKGSLLVALLVFGKMTAASEAGAAGISVSAATVKVGAVGRLAALAGSRIAGVLLAAAAIIVAGSIVTTSSTEKPPVGPKTSRAENILRTPRLTRTQDSNEECWYFFPEGGNQVVMTRIVKSDSAGKLYCSVLQNEYAEYHDQGNAIHITNHRWFNPDLSVRQLPTDSPAMSEFISQVQGWTSQMESVARKGAGLLVIAKHSGNAERISKVIHHENVLEEEYFQLDWPGTKPIIDKRDAIHRRGWTYFTVQGQVDGKEITGTGRIPFVYAASWRYPAWLKLKVADGPQVVDCSGGACIRNRGGDKPEYYSAGSFFAGLSRPWTGLHTIDTVRRDAAEEKVWFEARPVQDGNKVEISVKLKPGQGHIVYTVDLLKDFVEKISFSTDVGSKGELNIHYLQEIDAEDSRFAEPRKTGYKAPLRESPGIIWPLRLIEIPRENL